MKELVNRNDPYKMNWIEGNVEWGTVKKPVGIEVTLTSEYTDDAVMERYCFTNVSEKDIFTSLRDISIYTPFNDDYKDSATCIQKRCHTHIFCGEEITYIMALRMGGEGPHLGLTVTEGSIGGYSVERSLDKSSNDRGDFILHPSPVALSPGESFTVSWTLFWHEGKKDFYEKIKQYHKRYIAVNAENYTVFSQEEIRLTICPVFEFTKDDVDIKVNGKNVVPEISKTQIRVLKKADSIGEKHFDIQIAGVKTHCDILVLPALRDLIKRRCEFIVDKQQYHNPNSCLDGAYLIYDNEEKHIFYSKEHDRNGGRERIGMGILLARYLRREKNERFEKSLKKYIAYVERELFDKETGVVYNDCQRNNSWNRLYNYPWMSVFYLELHHLYGEREHLVSAYRALKSFYEQGGTHFYAIEVPVYEMISCLVRENMTDEKKIMQQYFSEHCSVILKNELHYPAHEVNYEQSIVGPAAEILMQMYQVTGEEKYLVGAKEQLNVLEMFNGLQPDYHLYEVAIRHWDGYWFGKNRMFGDTFPHYWSSLTANAYNDFFKITGEKSYLKKAEASYRGSLSLFMADGSASCACVYPVSVNGVSAGYYDPYANDQDWALYFMLRFRDI